ncbi:MAG: aminotransferase class V-fold PLP-dependent enzyme [Acidobacteriota bacterium]
MTYLNNAAFSHPKPEEVYADMDAAARRWVAYPGSRIAAGKDDARDLMEDTRRQAASLFGVSEPGRVIFTLNGTDALNIALKGFLKDGDHVLTTSVEPSAISRPLTHLQMKGRISLTRIEVREDGCIDPGRLERAIRHRTRLVAISHACSALGTVRSVEEIARITRRKNARLLVDAAHTAGVVPLAAEEWGIDLLAMSGHKGLLGPAGTGLLVVGPEVSLAPCREGWTGGDPVLEVQPLDLPWALESGMPNLPGIAGLRAGLLFLKREGVEKIREHQTTLVKRFIGAIGLDDRFHLYAARGDVPRTGTVAFSLRGFPPAELAAILARHYDIHVGAGLHGCPGAHRALKSFPEGTVRISLGCFNTEAEVDRTVAGLREIADSGLEQARELASRTPSEVREAL